MKGAAPHCGSAEQHVSGKKTQPFPPAVHTSHDSIGKMILKFSLWPEKISRKNEDGGVNFMSKKAEITSSCWENV